MWTLSDPRIPSGNSSSADLFKFFVVVLFFVWGEKVIALCCIFNLLFYWRALSLFAIEKLNCSGIFEPYIVNNGAHNVIWTTPYITDFSFGPICHRHMTT